jgi:hypothetical protein
MNKYRESTSPLLAAVSPDAVNPVSSVGNSSYDRFLARSELTEIQKFLRNAANHPSTHKYERALLESPFRHDRRMTLACFALAQVCETFVATVAERGCIGKQRSVMLKDLRPFGCRFIHEDHLWVPYNRLWGRVEPFYQGERMALVGTAVEYKRKNNTYDYTLVLKHVTRLSSGTKAAVPLHAEPSR